MRMKTSWLLGITLSVLSLSATATTGLVSFAGAVKVGTCETTSDGQPVSNRCGPRQTTITVVKQEGVAHDPYLVDESLREQPHVPIQLTANDYL